MVAQLWITRSIHTQLQSPSFHTTKRKFERIQCRPRLNGRGGLLYNVILTKIAQVRLKQGTEPIRFAYIRASDKVHVSTSIPNIEQVGDQVFHTEAGLGANQHDILHEYAILKSQIVEQRLFGAIQKSTKDDKSFAIVPNS